MKYTIFLWGAIPYYYAEDLDSIPAQGPFLILPNLSLPTHSLSFSLSYLNNKDVKAQNKIYTVLYRKYMGLYVLFNLSLYLNHAND